MSVGREDIFPSSQGLSTQNSCAVAASAISQLPIDCIQEVEKQSKFNNEQMQSMRLELKANGGVLEKLSTEVRSIQNSSGNDNDMNHRPLSELRDEEEFLKSQILEMEQLRNSLLTAFEKDVFEVAQLFTSAPDNFKPEKIHEDIQEESSQADEMCKHINESLDPKIKISENLMAKESVILFEFPGSSPEELTCKDLETFLSKLKESGQTLNQGIDGMLQECKALEQEENLI